MAQRSSNEPEQGTCVRGLGLEDIPIVIVTCGLCSLVPMEALSRKRKEPENIGAFKPLTSVE